MEQKYRDVLWTASLALSSLCSIYLVFSMLFPIGWDGSTEYLQYKLQFKPVHEALLDCSKAGGVLNAQIVGQETKFMCDESMVKPYGQQALSQGFIAWKDNVTGEVTVEKYG